MSRIGKQPVAIPEGTTVAVSSTNEVTVKGKLGELSLQVTEPIAVRVEDSVVTLERPNDHKDSRSKHGLYRALISNMVEGVSKGYTKELELVGVGYRASNMFGLGKLKYHLLFTPLTLLMISLETLARNS